MRQRPIDALPPTIHAIGRSGAGCGLGRFRRECELGRTTAPQAGPYWHDEPGGFEDTVDIRTGKPHESLERVGLLRSLDAKERASFEKRCVWRHAHAKEWLLEQNDDCTDIYFLTSGVVRVL